VIHYPYTDNHFNCHTFGARKYGTEMEITYNIFTQQFVSTQSNKLFHLLIWIPNHIKKHYGHPVQSVRSAKWYTNL